MAEVPDKFHERDSVARENDALLKRGSILGESVLKSLVRIKKNFSKVQIFFPPTRTADIRNREGFLCSARRCVNCLPNP